jgi:penicillin amidase
MRPLALYGLARLALRLGWAGLWRPPRPQSVAERLAALPTTGLPLAASVEIRWNAHLVPFIAAESDRDLAVALGLVHAHLRLAQLELFRRLAHGRLSEMLGTVAVPLDHTLRLLAPGRAVPAILAGLPPESRGWLDGFVAGINHHIAAAPVPFELRLLGIVPEPWTAVDVLSVARLAAADVNWILWTRLMRLPQGPDWPDYWARMLAESAPALDTDAPDAFGDIVRGTGRAGSNAFAIAGGFSRTGAPVLAGDPHLTQSLPSVWLAAAYRSPSYKLAGLMIPGIPVMAIGRNPFLAWGGSNLFAASSELFDVSNLPASAIQERRVRLQVRWSRPQEIVLRETEYGPLISDAPLFAGGGRQLALRWVGHHPSDELSALLAINRSRDWAEFRRAAAGLAVPGQTLVGAEASGAIGRMAVAHLPRRPLLPPTDFVSPVTAALAWDELATADELPAETDPPRGFVVTANDRPPISAVPIGWLFGSGDRAERLAELIAGGAPLDREQIADILEDVTAPAMLPLRDRLLAAMPNGDFRSALAGWDGRYTTGSAGALAFELVLAEVAARLLSPRQRALYGAAWRGRSLLAQDIAAITPRHLGEVVTASVRAAAQRFEDFRDWGGAHRLRLAHPLGRAPVIGRRYRFTDLAWPGSSETVMKAAHGPVTGRHSVSYGSNARYVFDMSDPNGNYLVILGGNDGALGSDAFLDQLDLFRRGALMRLPLDSEAAEAEFPHRTVIEPAGR